MRGDDLPNKTEHSFLAHLDVWVFGGLAIGLLYVGRELLIPIALATFFCLLLSPAAGYLERRAKLGRTFSVLIVVVASISIVALFGWIVGRQAGELIQEFPKYRDTIVSKVRVTRESVAGKFTRTTQALERLIQDTKVQSEHVVPGSETRSQASIHSSHSGGPTSETTSGRRAGPGGDEPVKVELVPQEPDMIRMIGAVLGPVVHPLATLAISSILLVFFLINRQDLRDRIIRLCGKAKISVTTAALDDCSHRVIRFLVAQAFVNCLIGTVIGCGLYFIGIPNAAFWGLLAAVARFIPYVGSITAIFLPFMLAVALFDSWQKPMLVVGWCVVIDLLSANVLEPLLYGARTGVSPTAILIAFIFWTWLWGGYGLFLATPITVCLVVAGKHIDAFESFYILFSDEPVLEPVTRFYQRLLACNEGEAAKVAAEFAVQGGVLGALDEVVLPSLAQVEYDRHSQLIDEHRQQFALNTAGDLLTSGELALPERPTVASPASQRSLVLVTASGLFDGLIAKILQKLARNLHIRDLSEKNLVSELVQEIEKTGPSGVIFAAIEPASVRRFRHVYKKLREDHIALPVHVMIFSASRRTSKSALQLTRECGSQENLSLAGLLARLEGDASLADLAGPAEDGAATGIACPPAVAHVAG